MQCPSCSGPMHELTYGRVRVDRCPACGSVWFDAHELAQARRRKTLGAKRTKTIVQPLDRTAGYPCPRCQADDMPLVKAQSFEVPRCGACRGFYFEGSAMRSLEERWRDQRASRRVRLDELQRAETLQRGAVLTAMIVAS